MAARAAWAGETVSPDTRLASAPLSTPPTRDQLRLAVVRRIDELFDLLDPLPRDRLDERDGAGFLAVDLDELDLDELGFDAWLEEPLLREDSACRWKRCLRSARSGRPFPSPRFSSSSRSSSSCRSSSSSSSDSSEGA